MKLPSFLRATQKKVATLLSMTGQGSGSASWTTRNFRGFAQEGYESNNVGFRCVDIIAKGLASVPLKVHKNEEILPDHPLQKLINKPNPNQTYAEFCYGGSAFKQIAGNSFIQALRTGTGGDRGIDSRGEPLTLWLWQPYQMTVLHNDSSMVPLGYQFLKDNGDKIVWSVERTGANSTDSNILHWKTFNPLDIWLGLPPMHPCGMSIDQHNESSRWNKMLLENKGAPSGAFISETSMSDENYKQLRKDINDRFSGAKNAGRPLLLEGTSMKYQQLSMTPSDLDWLNGRNSNSREICSTLGVPSQLLSIPGDQTYANFAEARIALWEDTIMPELNSWVRNLNEWLVPMFEEDGLILKPDLSQVPALDDKRATRMTALQPVTFLTDNEKREELGYDDYDETAMSPADQLWKPAGTLPIGFDILAGIDDDEQKVIALMDMGMERKDAVAAIRQI